MSKLVFPPEVLEDHIAILGKTGSGKTTTAKLVVEQVVEAGSRVCVLDPIKSDWWGLVLAANGRRPGLPFKILGGPRGHVPLHANAGKAIAGVVASGALPHSIIDMRDFEPGGQARFFTEFVPELIRRMKGVLYLVIEEAHLFAPKERSGIGMENMAIHWAKTLATAGRSAGVRLVVLSQRVQALHNAVLGSAETLIAHRLTAPADQEPVLKWLKTNAPKDVVQKVAESLGKLKTGVGWLCSGTGVFEEKKYPKATTYDNTFTPKEGDDKGAVKTPAVDVDALTTLVGSALEEAKANDPKELKAEIARLKAELAKKPVTAVAVPVAAKHPDFRHLKKGLSDAMTILTKITATGFEGTGIDPEVVKKAVETAAEQIVRSAEAKMTQRMKEFEKLKAEARLALRKLTALVSDDNLDLQVDVRHNAPFTVSPPAAERRPRAAPAVPSEPGTGELSGLERDLLIALAQHPAGLTKTAAVVYAGRKPSGDISKAWGRFATEGWTARTADGVRIEPAGVAALGSYEPLPTGEELRAYWLDKAEKHESGLLRVLFDRYPDGGTKTEIVEAAGYKPSGDISKAWGKFNVLGWVQRTAGGVRAADMWFE